MAEFISVRVFVAIFMHLNSSEWVGWYPLFSDPLMALVAMDRLFEAAEMIATEGNSRRSQSPSHEGRDGALSLRTMSTVSATGANHTRFPPRSVETPRGTPR